MHRGLEHGEKKAAWRSVLQCTAVYCGVLCCTNSSNYESHISLIILTYTRITDTPASHTATTALRSSREMAADNCTSQLEF